jgi:uncharacterized protein (TIGR03000 family)
MRPHVRALLLVPCCAALLLDGRSAPGQPKPDDRRATIVIRLPADAELTVDGKATTQTGEVRRFVSTPLEPGRRYTYTIKALIEPNNYTKITRTREVEVKPGTTVEVDLRTADPKHPDDIVIRYVPTPQPVVDAMLKLAGVKKGDVVYDLGCGDGRIVVTAVKDFGADRGVGYDLDPQRIAESRANAKEAGVSDRVEFRQENVLKIKDFKPVTVVTLYMSDELDEAMRPALQKGLRPGSRIVSHRFRMGDWKPDKTITLTHEGEEYELHLWTIK